MSNPVDAPFALFPFSVLLQISVNLRKDQADDENVINVTNYRDEVQTTGHRREKLSVFGLFFPTIVQNVIAVYARA